MLKEEISSYFRNLQDNICKALEELDGKKFTEESWERDGGGGGKSRVMQNGTIIEKGGVNFSEVYGSLPEIIKKDLQIESEYFYATGVSIVIHPESPIVPIIHMNVRYFETSDKNSEKINNWFGGGIDLTPHYVNEEDASFFHQSLKGICDKHDISYYPEFKKWADDYFFIKHRNETRGIGGIFFDRLSENELFTIEQRFDFVRDVGNAFIPIYLPLIKKNKDTAYSQQEKNWQLLRRGRYVEFNLLYDKGTKFGLETAGRVESILMSLPLLAAWQYNFQPQPKSREQQTMDYLKKGIDWI